MDELRNEEQKQTKGGADVASDELADKVSAEFTSVQTPPRDLPGEQAEPVMLEEEKVKDEIDIQIDLLKDPDWVVRREAAITLGEMGDER
ncbi:MAG TPA: HEAT repeat domain-containing protein, partial [Nitrospira sp.]|nr:HEAT repeat domain-containing protein [Nitrospira sp.]